MTEPTQSGISRRTLAKGAAWSVPAVAVAAAAPAMAASGGPPTITLGSACKLPGNSCGNVFVKGYIFDLTITNNTGQDIYLYNQTGYLITITENSPNISLFFQAAVDATTGNVVTFPYLLEDGDSLVVVLNAGENGNSANVQNITVGVSFPWGHTPTPPDPDGHPNVFDSETYASTPPISNPACQVALPPNCGGVVGGGLSLPADGESDLEIQAADAPAEPAADTSAEPAADAPAEPAADAPAEPAADAPAEPAAEAAAAVPTASAEPTEA